MIKKHIKHRNKNTPWTRYYYNARKRIYYPEKKSYCGLEFSITIKDVEDIWFRDKAWLLDKPSLDRKNNNIGYIKSNIRFIEHRENSGRNNRKGVDQYTLDGKFIKHFDSGRDALESVIFKRKGYNDISRVCNGYRKTAYGYIWKFTIIK